MIILIFLKGSCAGMYGLTYSLLLPEGRYTLYIVYIQTVFYGLCLIIKYILSNLILMNRADLSERS